MSHEHNTNTFGELFRTYRLRAGIETLAMFANLMAEKGLVYENSLFSRWQRNERIPRERKIIITTLAIFAARGGIKTAEEANEFLYSVDQRELTVDELEHLNITRAGVAKKYEIDVLEQKQTASPKHHLSLAQLLFRSRIAYTIFGLFLIQCFLFYYVWVQNLYGTLEAYTAGYLYGYIAVIGVYFGLARARKYQQLNSRTSVSIRYLCYGLLAQILGLQVWFYNNLKGIEVPYPSMADFGYLSLIPCYIYVALNIANPALAARISDFFKKRGFVIFLPAVLAISTSLLYFYARGVEIRPYIADILDIAYPVGQTIPMTILTYALVFKMQHATRFERTSAIAILIGFFLQFTAEYTFIFSARLNIYVNTGLIDFIYCVSYTYMALVIVALTNANTAFAKSFVAAGKTAHSKQSQPLPMSRRLAHVEPIQ